MKFENIINEIFGDSWEDTFEKKVTIDSVLNILNWFIEDTENKTEIFNYVTSTMVADVAYDISPPQTKIVLCDSELYGDSNGSEETGKIDARKTIQRPRFNISESIVSQIKKVGKDEEYHQILKDTYIDALEELIKEIKNI